MFVLWTACPRTQSSAAGWHWLRTWHLQQARLLGVVAQCQTAGIHTTVPSLLLSSKLGMHGKVGTGTASRAVCLNLRAETSCLSPCIAWYMAPEREEHGVSGSCFFFSGHWAWPIHPSSLPVCKSSPGLGKLWCKNWYYAWLCYWSSLAVKKLLSWWPSILASESQNQLLWVAFACPKNACQETTTARRLSRALAKNKSHEQTLMVMSL